MTAGIFRLFAVLSSAAVFTVLPALVSAQETDSGVDDLQLPGITNFAPPRSEEPLAKQGQGQGVITLSARMTDEGEDISHGLVWRVFGLTQGADGKLPLIASDKGGTTTFHLEPGSYLVHAAFGRAGATKRMSVTADSKSETLVLDAGGLELDAVLSGGKRIPADKLRFSIYDEKADESGDRALIIPDVKPNTVVRLNSGVYHIVSTYGSVNAIIRSDIRVEAGKLTEASVEHRAAEMTFKLVREAGGEAIADTSWSILTESGDPVREAVGAFASAVLSEGDYIIIAKNRDRIYQRDFSVVAGQNQDVEVTTADVASETQPTGQPMTANEPLD
ncbi:hypothetical protein ABFT80_16460 [Mesorhizobium sp. SB112]|uniref:hypothetical protein n=1 Tax=Mesorhizobium sp. SB112 TaxID=3151853 RepID=UPI00326754EC